MAALFTKLSELHNQLEAFDEAVEDYNTSPIVKGNDDMYLYGVTPFIEYLGNDSDFNYIIDINDAMNNFKNQVKNFDDTIWNITNGQTSVSPQTADQVALLKERYIALLPTVKEYLYTKVLCFALSKSYDVPKLIQYAKNA